MSAASTLELAEHGKPAGQLGWGVRNNAERELVRGAAHRVLDGQGLMTIAPDWNRRGVPGATEHPWTGPTLRKVSSQPGSPACESTVRNPQERSSYADAGNLGGAVDRQTSDHVRSVLLNPDAGRPEEHVHEVPVDWLDLLWGLRRPHGFATAR